MAAEVTTRFLAEDEYPSWAAIVAASPDGSAYALPEYLRALCDATGGRFRVLVAERDQRIVGGIALYESSGAQGAYVATRRLLYYNGFVLAPHDSKYPSQRAAWQLQALGALEHAVVSLGYARVRIRSRSTQTDARLFLGRGWHATPTYSYVVDISDPQAAWTRVDKNLRRLVGRCREQGLVVTFDDDFEEFFRLHAQTHDRKGAPIYLPREAFRGFHGALCRTGLARLYHARLPGGRVIASQLVLRGPHPITHTIAAAADAEFLSLGASAFLRWQVFEDLARAGYRGNDLTDAELNPVTHFKSQLGGDLVLCLELARPDALRWRMRELVAKAPQRVHGAAVRLLHATRKNK